MVAIKEMSTPERCDICPFYLGVHEGTCLISEIYCESHNMNMPEYYRQDWCPLIEIEEREGKDNE